MGLLAIFVPFGGDVSLKKRVIFVAERIVSIFIEKHVMRSAAALSYYLTITIFPLLICVSAILGSLNLTEESIFKVCEGIIPEATISIISEFMRYVSGNKTTLMIIVGVGVMITTSSAAFRTILGIMGDIQGKRRYSGIFGGILSFIMSFAFLLAIYGSGVVIVSGEWLLGILAARVGFTHIFELWYWIRFVLLFLLLFGIIYAIYLVSAPKETKRTHRLPGALVASVLLVAVSIIFSRMISESVKYAIVYGSLASFIIMMVWIYMCGVILIMGNVVNISLREPIKALE